MPIAPYSSIPLTFADVSCRYCLSVSTSYLNNEHRIDLLIVLFAGILIPMEAFVFPLIGSNLQYSHIVIGIGVFRIFDHNAFLQKTG